MILRFLKIHALVAACFTLTACATFAPRQPASPGPGPLSSEYQRSLDLGGRLSVRYQGDRQEESLHGSFQWTQTPERTTVTLLSPLGQTVAVIDVTPGRATLSRAGQPPHLATDVDTLTAEVLGWPLPVAGLREWLQGVITNSKGEVVIASPENTEFQSMDGWMIRYPAWTDEGRPRRLDLTRSTTQAGDVAIRIVIDSWQIH